MPDDEHYLEADDQHTAGGRRVAAEGERACWMTLIGEGWASVHTCALPHGHDGSHESFGGTSWDDPQPTDPSPDHTGGGPDE